MVQTFLPYPDFVESARALDQKRLGKQRVEDLQIMRALTVPGHGWRNHPAAKMWAGHRGSLMDYHLAVCAQWTALGFADTTVASTLATFEQPSLADPDADTVEVWRRGGHRPPSWLGDDAVHRSHRSRLRQKDPDHYRPLFPDTPDDLDYVWPLPS